MRYTTTYDIGDRKRAEGSINEDSIAVTVMADGHRAGYRPPRLSTDGENQERPTVHGPGDEATEAQEEDTDSSVDRAADSTATSDPLDPNRRVDSRTQVYQSNTNRGSSPQNREAGIFVLADGAGGEQAGDIASYIATTVIRGELAGIVSRAQVAQTDGFDLDLEPGDLGEVPDEDEIIDAITEAVAAANRRIIKYAQKAEIGGIYTTIVAGVYLGSRLYYGWIGDSRLYVVNGRHDEITPLTKDHSKVTQWEDEGRIDEVEAHVHPDGNEIRRALGGGAEMTVEQAAEQARQDMDTSSVDLFREDTVLLTSDGLIDAQTDARDLYRDYVTSERDAAVADRIMDSVVTDNLIRDVIVQSQSLESSAERFVTLSNERGGKDNISLIMFRDGNLPASPDPEVSSLPNRAIDPVSIEERETILRSE